MSREAPRRRSQGDHIYALADAKSSSQLLVSTYPGGVEKINAQGVCFAVVLRVPEPLSGKRDQSAPPQLPNQSTATTTASRTRTSPRSPLCSLKSTFISSARITSAPYPPHAVLWLCFSSIRVRCLHIHHVHHFTPSSSPPRASRTSPSLPCNTALTTSTMSIISIVSGLGMEDRRDVCTGAFLARFAAI